MPQIELTNADLDLLDVLPHPTWLFAPNVLQVCFANAAFCDWLGYSVGELNGMTIADIRPQEDRRAIRAAVDNFDQDRCDAGLWRILTKSGETRHARFQWQRAFLDGKDVVLATVADETSLKALSDAKQELEEKVAEGQGIAVQEFRALFEQAPCKMLALRPKTYEIVAVSDAYLEATMTAREEIRGKRLFDVFPDDPDDPQPDGEKNLRDSLRRVEALNHSDYMAVQRYPIRREDGSFEERYWAPLNQPVFGVEGNLAFIIHRVEDISSLVAKMPLDEVYDKPIHRSEELVLSAFQAANEMRESFMRIDEHEARLRTAERLMNIGAWEYDFEFGQTNWSRKVFDIYGVPEWSKAPSFEEYVELVHPDDRQQMIRTYQEFFQTGARQIHFAHRVIRDDGSVGHIRGVGERHPSFGKEIVVGLVQEVTEEFDTAKELSFAQDLVRIAGEKARVGGWRLDLNENALFWTDETAVIHDVDPGYRPSLEEGIYFYLPEHRPMVVDAVDALAADGTPFDFKALIETAKGRQIWVRAIGEAERDASGKIVAIHGAFQDIDDLVKAQATAQKLQKDLSNTLEHIKDAFFTVDTKWRFNYMNRHAEYLLKRSKEDLEGKVLWNEFPEAVGTRFEKEYRSAVDHRVVARFREYFGPLDLWVEVNAYPLPDGLAVYFRDIGEQIKRDERLTLLETAISRASDIVMITEAEPLDAPDGPKILYVNEAFERRTGYSPSEVIGKTPRILQGADTDEAELKRIGALLRKWQPVRSELKNYRKSGEPFWLELDIVPIADDSGWFTHWVAIERDITDRKLSLEKERRSKEMFQAISEVTNDFVWEYDVPGDQWLRNERHLRMIGLPDEKAPLSFDQTVKIVHADDQARFAETFLNALDSDATSWELDYRIIDGEGRVRYMENQAAIVRGEDGKALRVVGGLTDVTKVRDLDRQFREAQKMEAIGNLTGGVAHDFNNLLTIILGNAEELSDRLSDDNKLRILAEMTATAAERGAELTNRLLAFARRQILEPVTLNINKEVQGMDNLLRRTLPETISIEVVSAAGLWLTELDPGQIENAILNLCINARDAMPRGGKLTIETANTFLDEDYAAGHPDLKPGQYVMVSVTDTGAGMDAETQARVFEPFFTTKPIGKGSGLGLSMVFGFVKQSAAISMYTRSWMRERPSSCISRDRAARSPISGNSNRRKSWSAVLKRSSSWRTKILSEKIFIASSWALDIMSFVPRTAPALLRSSRKKA
jgi:PAS domain S-box-containing protein